MKVLTFAIVALLSLAPAARAAEPSTEEAPFAPRASSSAYPLRSVGSAFGVVGQWVVSVQTANDASSSFYFHKHSGGGWQLNVHPALDYFLTSSVSIGGVVGFTYDSGGVTTLGLGARAGYAFSFGGDFGFWPTAGVFTTYATGNHMSDGRASFGLYAPFLYHPAGHLFLGIGPTFNLGLTDGNPKDYGLDFVIGGWI